MSIDTFRFLGMVAPVTPDTWVTVHHRVFLPGNPEPIFPGNAHQTIQSAQRDAEYWARKGHCVYISMGMYRNPGQSRSPYPRADRTYKNLVSCKNHFMDVDVKKGGYSSTAEAAAAIKGFLEWSRLPPPTVLVGSGSGGFHIYWTMNDAFDYAEFQNMSGRLIAAAVEYGLLFDRQCTRDATRLLRVAGTWNFKYVTEDTPATPVTLDYCVRDHIDLKLMNKALSRWPVTLTHEGKANLRVVGGTDLHGLPLDENSDLSGGMERDFPPVSIDEVAKYCPFIKDTLDTGGAGYSEPLWKYSMALAARCENPEDTAHKLSRGHAEYDPEATLQKLAQNHGSGPPMCATIAILAPQCATCAHRDRGTTPLAVGFKQPTNGRTHSFALTAIPPGQQSINLPDAYYQDPVTYQVYKHLTDTGKPNNNDGLVFEYPLLGGSTLEFGTPFQFTINTIQGGAQVAKRFDSTVVADTSLCAKAFASVGLPLTTKAEQTRQFMASYLNLLQSRPETLITVPAFGWSLDKNKEMGFAFAGEFVSPAGTAQCARPQEGTEHYRVMGSEQVWIDLMKNIIASDRPDIACMVAASFAAPLVSLTGESGLLMGVTSSASGIGKSTALLGGQAVWSSPVVGGLSDTANYTFAKCSTLRHLPVFYDEIKGEPQLKVMTQIAFQLTRGQEKGRSDRSGKMRKVNEFKTLCGYAANGSIVDGVRTEDKGTDASWLRMFEMEGIKIRHQAPNFASKVNDLLVGLNLNHGGVGRKYATYLGQNHKSIYASLANAKAQFGQLLGADPKVERFWVAAIASTMLAANIANSLGVVKFPLIEMGQFMFSEFGRMKKEMAEDPNDLSKDNALRMTIGTFLNEKQPRNMVKLDKTWMNPTRPPKGYANVLNDKPDNAWGKLEVQVSGDPLMLRISDVALSEWCLKTKHPKNNLVAQMKSKLGAKFTTGMIGSGSRLAGARENVWAIKATGTIIEADLEYGIHNKFLPP